MPVSKKPRNQKFAAGSKLVVSIRNPRKSAAKIAGVGLIMRFLKSANTQPDIFVVARTVQMAAAYNNVSA